VLFDEPSKQTEPIESARALLYPSLAKGYGLLVADAQLAC
jgi:hypothetical protein